MAQWMYVGRMDDPEFDWGCGAASSRVSNVPRPITPNFPPASAHGSAHGYVLRLVQEGKLEGKRTDWGASVARASQADVLAVLDACYPTDPVYGRTSTMPWLREQLDALYAAVLALDPLGEYALVIADL